MNVEMEDGRVWLHLTSPGKTVSYIFSFDEWEGFVDAVKWANASMAGEED